VTSEQRVFEGPGRLLGIDGGGSGTRVVLVEGGQVTALPDGPPMNALLTRGLAEHLRHIIAAAGPTAAGVGLPGVRVAGQACHLGRALARQAGCPVHVTGDADAARHAAFLGAPGVVVIAGTGSVALGWDGERFARAGGHGFLLGDEGSAYWIGREAVRAALRFQDRSGGSEQIHRMVTEVTGSGLDVLIAEVNAHPADRGRLAVLAPAVTAIAGHDPEAQRIVRQAADSLAALAESIRRRLGPLPTETLPTETLPTGTPPTGTPPTGTPPTGALPVAGVGGVFRDPALWARFAELTGATRPLAPAAVGAALLAATCTPRSPTAPCSLHLDLA
jgi:glucosamine kinase